MKIHFGNPTKHAETGQIGSTVHLNLEKEAGYDGRYVFDTFGMKPADVKAKVDALRAHHAAKAQRLDGFKAAVRDHQIAVQGRTFQIVDCTLWESAGEVELYVDVREIGSQRRIRGFPIIRRFASIDVVPDNEAIIAQATTIVSDQVATEIAHQDYVAKAKALLNVP